MVIHDPIVQLFIHNLHLSLSLSLMSALLRFSVIVMDIVFVLAAWKLCCKVADYRADKSNKKQVNILFTMVLLQPSLILIDHGHFQYNSCSLGLAMAGAVALMHDYDLFGSVLFTLALNFKQMCLYYAPVFFFYLLAKCWRHRQPFIHLVLVGLSVILTFAMLWFPFCVYSADGVSCTASLLQGMLLLPNVQTHLEKRVCSSQFSISK
jgi:alpha-1,3-glucosyltransferase